MELRQLEYFVATAEEQSFTRAASRCLVAQSALSHQIAKLEAEFGAPLLVRARPVRLTAEGAAALPVARQVLAGLDRLRNEVAAVTGVLRGTLRLGLIQSLGEAFDLPAVLQAYGAAHPGVDLRISSASSASMIDAVQAGRLDLAVAGLAEDELPSGLSQRVLFRDPLVLVTAPDHPLSGKCSVDLRELGDGVRCVDFLPGSALRRQVDHAFARAGVTRVSAFVLDQMHEMLRLAVRGLGVTIAPRSFLAGIAAALGEYRTIRLTDAEAVQTVGLVYAGQAPAPAVKAFLHLVESNTGTPPQRWTSPQR